MSYFYLRQQIPILLMMFYIVNRLLENEWRIFMGNIVIFIASIFIIYLYPENMLVALEWVIYILLSYLYLIKKRDVLFSLTYSILSSSFGGWLYELPYFHPTFMFYDSSCPLYIHTQLLSGIFIFFMLIKEKVKLNKIIIYSFIFFIISEMFFYFKVSYYKQVFLDLFLLSRLGIMILLFSFLTGLNKDVKIHI